MKLIIYSCLYVCIFIQGGSEEFLVLRVPRMARLRANFPIYFIGFRKTEGSLQQVSESERRIC